MADVVQSLAEKCRFVSDTKHGKSSNGNPSNSLDNYQEPKDNIGPKTSKTKQARIDRIGDEELKKMKLSASACKTANFRIRKYIWTLSGNSSAACQRFRHPCAVKANETFFIKSRDWKHYGQSLGFRSDVRTSPGPICPDPELHEERMLLHSADLPLVCPTCWSAQRNALPPLKTY